MTTLGSVQPTGTGTPRSRPAVDPDRERAARIVADLAARLADPEHVAAAAITPDNVDFLPGMSAPASPWGTLGLGEAQAGVVLLYAELSHQDSGFRSVAHRHLTRAARGLAGPPAPGLFGGAASLAFAACVARHSESDYAGLLDALDAQVTDTLRELLGAERERLRAGRPGVRMSAYDAIVGATGLGRYLLLRGDPHRALLADTLSYLVDLTHPVVANGHTVPGWWVPVEPGRGPQFPGGHFNLGMAHGISGPLALLSLAWRAGVRVPGQQDAIARIAEHLLEWRTDSGLWPGIVDFGTFTGSLARHEHHSEMIAWCYGTPGTARALHLAGLALGRQRWLRVAVDTLLTAVGEPADTITDASLCHGWAGVLHTADLVARDSADPHLTARLPRLLAPILDAYDPELPFGFRYERPKLQAGLLQAPHRASFLEGAAGIALALHAYASGGVTAAPWDAALLLD